MGSKTEVVERHGRYLWTVVPWGSPVVSRRGKSSTPSSHGSGHDVFDTAKFLLRLRTLGLSWIEWIWDNIAPDVRVKKNLPGPKTYEKALAAWKDVGPKMEMELPLN